MFTYRLHLEDGSDAGDATYSVMIRPGEEIIVGNGQRFRVLDLIPVENEHSPYARLLLRSDPRGGLAGHVGIYIGGGRMMEHSSRPESAEPLRLLGG